MVHIDTKVAILQTCTILPPLLSILLSNEHQTPFGSIVGIACYVIIAAFL